MSNQGVIAVFLFFLSLFSPIPVFCETPADELLQFQKNNPDGQKYEFVRDYISSLSYLRSNLGRDDQLFQSKEQPAFDRELIQARIGSLVQNNVNMRIARNLLEKYRNSTNGLILKTTDLFTTTSNQFITLNNEERQLLQAMVKDQKEEIPKDSFQRYVKSWQDLSSQRKTLLLSIVESSLLVTKVLISEKPDRDGQLTRLGVTWEEREKLVEKLNQYFKETDDLGMQEGQTYLEASVANLREVLEDHSHWESLDPKEE